MKKISVFADVEQVSVSTGVEQISMSMNYDVMQSLRGIILSNRLELFMFFSAVLGYLILYSARFRMGHMRQKRYVEEVPAQADAASQEDEALASILDHCNPLGVLVDRILRSIPCQKKGSLNITRELCVFSDENSNVCDMSSVNYILEQLGEHIDSELTQQILEMLPSIGLNPDQRTYEILLKAHVAANNFSEISSLEADMRAREMPVSARGLFFLMKAAVQAHDFHKSLRYFKELKVVWTSQCTSEPLVSQSIMTMLVDLASEKHSLDAFVAELKEMPLPEKTIDSLLTKCIESSNSGLAITTESLARAQRTTLPDSTCSLLIRASIHIPLRARKLVEEALARKGSVFAPDLATSVIDFCSCTSDVAVADQLFERMKPKPLHVLCAFLWFYISVEQFEKVCDIYELDVQPMVSVSVSLEACLQQSIIDAAVVCGRNSLAERLVSSSMSTSGGFGLQATQFVTTTSAVLARCHATIAHWAVLVF